MSTRAFLSATLFGLAAAQSLGAGKEVHPELTTYKCTIDGGCKPLKSGIVLDAASHSIHQRNNTALGCGNWGSGADPVACPDKESCAHNCVLEPIQDYSTGGVFTEGETMRLDLYNPSGNFVSPRVYLLAEDMENYEMLELTGNELSFDVDVSRLPCGMNGALYLSEMRADGGKSALNPGGAAYGTGYCDAQCYVTPWVNGEVSLTKPFYPTSTYTYQGNIDAEGVCCNEMDIWEANARSNSIAPHPCSSESLFTCTGDDCLQPAGVCDKWGCVDNPYKQRNDKEFYGPGLKVDTTKPFTVVTQFPAEDGILKAIVRKYVQNGVVVENTQVNVTMDEAFCDAQGAGTESFNRLGGLPAQGGALTRGSVLALSVWWDEGGNMTWLDSGDAGPCLPGEGNPKFIQEVEPRPTVTFSKIKWGEIGSTFGGAAHNSSMSYRWKA
jgi:cellulase